MSIADLEARLAALRARPDAGTMGQRMNIADLEDQLADARAAAEPAPDVVHRVRPRDIPYAGKIGRTVLVEVSRAGTSVRLYRGRARPIQEHRLLIDGVPQMAGTRRQMMRQAHLAVAYGPGVMPPALALLGRALARWRHERRKEVERRPRRARRAFKRMARAVAQVDARAIGDVVFADGPLLPLLVRTPL